MPGRFVFDSFAVLSFVCQEPGAVRVRELLDEARTGETELHLTTVNLGEVVYTVQFREDADAASRALSRVHSWPIQLANIDEELALMAAQLKAARRLGYLDCFPAALAQRLNATVLTGDPDFQRVEDLVPIEWLER